YQAALLGQGGKGLESAPVGNEACEQKCRGKCVGVRVPGGEAQRHGRIHEKVERDIEESAAIGRPRCPRNGAIEPIGEAICDQHGQGEVEPSGRDGERRRKSEQTSRSDVSDFGQSIKRANSGKPEFGCKRGRGRIERVATSSRQAPRRKKRSAWRPAVSLT